MPKLGYDMTEGKLLHWLKHEGDSVRAGEAIFEIETDKVNLEVEASDSGILQHILVHEGEVAAVGERLGVLVVPGEQCPSCLLGAGTLCLLLAGIFLNHPNQTPPPA